MEGLIHHQIVVMLILVDQVVVETVKILIMVMVKLDLNQHQQLLEHVLDMVMMVDMVLQIVSPIILMVV